MTDCGPHNRAVVHTNTGGRVVFTWLKPYFNVEALIFYVNEESSQLIEPIKLKKYGIHIFECEVHDL